MMESCCNVKNVLAMYYVITEIFLFTAFLEFLLLTIIERLSIVYLQ